MFIWLGDALNRKIGRRVVYIIPGYKQLPLDKKFKELAKLFKRQNITPILVKIKWTRNRKDNNMTGYIDQFMKVYQDTHKKGDDTYLFGFSFGSFISFVASIDIKPKTLILCSLSPYFKEDLRFLKKSWLRSIGKDRTADFRKFGFNKLAKRVGSKTLIIFGTKEAKKYPELSRRVKLAHKLIKRNILIKIENADHDIGQKEYLIALKELLHNKEIG